MKSWFQILRPDVIDGVRGALRISFRN
jgi:hypothetical protein